ncbi:U8 snoRNA-decapping enzyme-like [Polypterus senegalus]|uniref:U8 snoRNA-decapping enzyme-like n=1 Tax=Polypterus senegalus TaxID=55291 RepID=UPI00196377EB|nr:U8 snoRNA-decapping enzyme-like [Polypterus senegalus]
MSCKLISREKSLQLPSAVKHACHAMLYAPSDEKLFSYIPVKYAVLMQMRFDGQLGFPGGFVDLCDHTLEEGLKRELSEELDYTLDFAESDHMYCHIWEEPFHLVTHFYTKRLTLAELRAVEAAAVQGKEFGLETMGLVRVPLFFLHDGKGGLPSFLCNNFIGNARSQLVDALKSLGIVKEEQLKRALKSSSR